MHNPHGYLLGGILFAITLGASGMLWSHAALTAASRKPVQPQVLTYFAEYEPTSQITARFVSGEVMFSVTSHAYSGYDLDEWADRHRVALAAAIATFPPNAKQEFDDGPSK